jgi:fructose-1,6-bisphosphatase I
MDKEILNIQGFILTEQSHHQAATGELSSILTEIAFGAKIVSREINKAGLIDVLGLTGKINVQGEQVQKLDEYANDIFIKILRRGRHVAALASEENDDILDFSKNTPEAKYVVCIDPLDGSSNIDANVSVGTIFSIYAKLSDASSVYSADFLQKGSQQVCAGYILYGSSTVFVYTTGHGVNCFTLDPSIGEFILSHPDLKIPTEGKVYSVNEGYSAAWQPGIMQYVEALKKGLQGYKKPHKARYIGSLVSDFHRNLLYGGIYLYPPDTKSPSGKLRLLFEANPMAFIITQAGGRATNGVQDILAIQPTEIHERVPLYIGSSTDITHLLASLNDRMSTQRTDV